MQTMQHVRLVEDLSLDIALNLEDLLYLGKPRNKPLCLCPRPKHNIELWPRPLIKYFGCEDCSRILEYNCKDPRDVNLQVKTNEVLSTLAYGVDVRALSLDSLKEITECLLEMNQEVVKVILDSKKDIWRNEELFELVQDYFNDSLHALDFYASLENCLKHVRDAHLQILAALHCFEEEDGEGRCSYSKILEELTKFKEAGDPFTKEFFEIFQTIYKQQKSMLKNIQTWRKISSMILVATFAAILIYSVMTAMVASLPVMAVPAAATTMDAIGKWIDSLWKNYEEALKRPKEVITSMQASIFVALKVLDKMRITIDPLDVQMKSLLQKADFLIEAGAEALKLGIVDIKKKLRDFMKDVEGLGKDVDMCSRIIQRSRLVVVQRIDAIENCC
ncbi:hypothetical protein EUGRSUZ_G01899 [Eucalyptus grandis]|uniref:Uncharacterized protein n=2 Tax=Eucalyptus grandis TaxID=71139 RepID=A0ACC3K2X4_EUCGR|nr:hypothetical protein EUGRSUZ_G01899 [Eucalyptus grandis]